MFVRIIKQGEDMVCVGKCDRAQKWSNAKRSAKSVLKRWPCKSYNPTMAHRFIQKQGHVLI